MNRKFFNKYSGTSVDELLSSVMDGEADDRSVDRVLEGMKRDGQILEKARRYSMTGRMLRGEDDPFARVDLCGSIREKIDADEKAASSRAKKVLPMNWFGYGAVAASAALFLVFSVYYGDSRDSSNRFELVDQPGSQRSTALLGEYGVQGLLAGESGLSFFGQPREGGAALDGMPSSAVAERFSVYASVHAILSGASSALQSVSLESAGVPAPADNGTLWLAAMVNASKSLTYRGYTIYQRGGSLESVVVRHAAIEEDSRSVELKSVSWLNGAERTVRRYGENILLEQEPERFGAGYAGIVTPLLLGAGRFESERLKEYYRVGKLPSMRVSDRSAIGVSVRPLDNHRYGYELWIDAETALLLKTVTVDQRSQQVELMQTVALELPDSLSESELTDMQMGFASADTGRIFDPVSGQEWAVGWVPPGFELTAETERTSPVSEESVGVYSYSDGLSGFSIFVEREMGEGIETSERVGALVAVSKVFRHDERYFSVIVIGDIPPGTAERVALSVYPGE